MDRKYELKESITANNLKYKVITYGCQMNEHESEKIRGMVEELGYVPATSDDYDLAIFNTCCIRENAEKKIFGNIGALKKRKAENKKMIIAVCGCMTQQKKVAERMYRSFPFVDIILGTHNISSFAQMLEYKYFEKKRIMELTDDTGITEGIPLKREEGPLASVNIMYGCNNFCSYCIVPYVRGRERSRNTRAILDEINNLTAEGYREVLLLGQNVNSYHGDDASDFPQLLKKICKETSIKRLRFMTSHPKDLSDDLIEVIKDNKALCKHIHLPVQSGSSEILKRMNRAYTREQYLEKIAMIRSTIPEMIITTDIIVGFPGETEADYKETLSLIRGVEFDSAYTFVYSKREGTKAALMENTVDEALQKSRIMELIDVQNEITERKNAARVGKIEAVLVEGASKRDNNHMCGRTDGGITVNFPGSSDLGGKFVDVKITQAKRTTLFGELM